MFHKEGHNIILFALVFCISLVLIVDMNVADPVIKYSLIAVFIIVLILILQFFRNPKRTFEPNISQVVSPVDGKVVVIEEVFEKEYFNDKRIQISVFMSPLNVHVTRYPVGGNVVFSKYHKGKYLVAWHPKSSEENERTTVVFETKNGVEYLCRQIAGAAARRIVWYVEDKKEYHQGEDFGFIKFGSRVDVFLPIGTKVNVELNQKSVGGQTVLAELI